MIWNISAECRDLFWRNFSCHPRESGDPGYCEATTWLFRSTEAATPRTLDYRLRGSDPLGPSPKIGLRSGELLQRFVLSSVLGGLFSGRLGDFLSGKEVSHGDRAIEFP